MRARKELAEQGWDNGALTIRWRLLDIARSGVHPTGGPVLEQAKVPSRATVHRILVERGQVTPAPRKRPGRGRRFVHPAPNAVWQIDGTDLALADGTKVTVMQSIDDHSRLDVACRAVRSENSEDVWAALSAGFAGYGHPACLLSDNGTAFSGKRHGWAMVRPNVVWPGSGSPPSCPRSGTPRPAGEQTRPPDPAALARRATCPSHPGRAAGAPSSLPPRLQPAPPPEPERRHPPAALPRHRPRPTCRPRPARRRAPDPHRLTHRGDPLRWRLDRPRPPPRRRHSRGVLARRPRHRSRHDTVAASLTLDRSVRYQRTTNLSAMC